MYKKQIFVKNWKITFSPFQGVNTVIDVLGQAALPSLCWNFEGLVLAHSGGYRDELKTHSRHLLGAHVGHKTFKKYGGLSRFKTVLVLILALLFSSSSPPLKPFETFLDSKQGQHPMDRHGRTSPRSFLMSWIRF